PRRPAAGVHHVGDLALQLLAVFVEERHRPAAVPGPARGLAYQCRPLLRRTAQAPVRVATSTRWVAPSSRAYQRASPRTRRPSASVLMTSTVLPLAPVRT